MNPLEYAKAIAAAAGSVLIVLAGLVPIDSTWQSWVQGALAVCTAVAVYSVSNAVAAPPSV